LKRGPQFAVENVSTDLKKQMCAGLGPTHLLSFDHALAQRASSTVVPLLALGVGQESSLHTEFKSLVDAPLVIARSFLN
jgi:hypothetical protein